MLVIAITVLALADPAANQLELDHLEYTLVRAIVRTLRHGKGNGALVLNDTKISY